MYLIYYICNKKEPEWKECNSSFITLGIFSTPEKGMDAIKWARKHTNIGDLRFKGIQLKLDDLINVLHPWREDGFIPDEFQCFREDIVIKNLKLHNKKSILKQLEDFNHGKQS